MKNLTFAGVSDFFFTKNFNSMYADKLRNFAKEAETLFVDVASAKNHIYAIWYLFKFTSKWQDINMIPEAITYFKTKKDIKKYENILKLLNLMSNTLNNAGRCEHGYNRTKKGEEVTLDKIYLGDVFGIWTNKASFWLAREEEMKNQGSGAIPTEASGLEFISVWYCINNYQCESFVKGHMDNLMIQVPKLQIELQKL